MSYFIKPILFISMLAGLSSSVIAQDCGDANRALANQSLPEDFGDDFKPADSVTQLNSQDWQYFDSLSSPDGTRQLWVKFSLLLDNSGEPQLLFQNTRQFPFHADFLATLPQFRGLSADQINALIVNQQGRKALVGTVIYTERMDGHGEYGKPKWTAQFDLVSKDPLDAEQVNRIKKLLAKQVDPNFIAKYEYLPTPEQQVYVRQHEPEFRQLGIEIVSHAASEKPIIYSSGWSLGRIKRVKAEELDALVLAGEILPDHILVMDKAPSSVPPVAGIIVETESSPNSHVALFSKMSGGIFVYLKNCFSDPKWNAYETSNAFVFVAADGDSAISTISVQEGFKTEEVEKLKELSRFPAPEPPARNLEIREIRSLEKLSKSSVDFVGAKAANYSELLANMETGIVEVNGFAIPFYYYEKFLNTSTYGKQPLGEWVRKKLASIEPVDTPLHTIYENLAAIREVITKAKIDKSVLKPIVKAVNEHFPEATRIRFRSSSNVEDNPNFNGAGLYRSKGVDSDSEKSVAKGLRAVWASVFNDRAYMARRQFGFEEPSVSMGILVHPSFKGETARGVAVLKIPPHWSKESLVQAVFTGFPGEDLEVTNPPSGKVPESTRVEAQPHGDSPVVSTLVTTSELPIGRRVLTNEQYQKLFDAMSKFYLKWVDADKTIELDFEWKWMPDGPRVKQVREVPKPVSSRRPPVENPFILPFRNRALEADLGEDSDGLLLMKLKQKPIKASFGLFEFGKGLSERVPFESIEIGMWDGSTRRVSTSDLRSEFEQTEWEPTYPGADDEARMRKWTIYIPDADLRSLRIVATLPEYRKVGSDSPVATRPFFDVTDLELNAFALKSDFPHLKNASQDDDLGPGSDTVRWRLIGAPSIKVETSQRQAYDQSVNFDGEGLSIQVEGTSSFGGYDKTFFYKSIKKTQVEGVTTELLVFSDSTAMYYAPAHHNFSWQYIFDLTKAENLTPRQEAEIEALGGRYLIVESFLSDNQGDGQPPTYNVKVSDEAGKSRSLGRVKGVANPPMRGL